jgi:hypothetical protein
MNQKPEEKPEEEEVICNINTADLQKLSIECPKLTIRDMVMIARLIFGVKLLIGFLPETTEEEETI